MEHTIYVHRVLTESPMILEEGHYALKAFVTIDDEPFEDAKEKYFYFGDDLEAEAFIKVVNSSFEPIALRVIEDEDGEGGAPVDERE